MSKYNPSKLSKKYRDALIKEFSKILSDLGKPIEIQKFLQDLLTESEEIMLARRLQVAKMLLKDYSYGEIREKLKVGYDNIRSVRHFLDFGWGGYINAIGKKKKRIYKNPR